MAYKTVVLEHTKDKEVKDIIQELIEYRNRGIDAYCLINGKRISNGNINELKTILEMIELNIPLEKYREYRKIKEYEFYREQMPYLERYWVERGKTAIEKSKWDEWEYFCYKTYYDEVNSSQTFEKNIDPSYLISAIKIMLYLDGTYTSYDDKVLYKVIDEELTPKVIENTYIYNKINEIIERFCKEYWRFKELACYDEVQETTESRIKRKIKKLAE